MSNNSNSDEDVGLDEEYDNISEKLENTLNPEELNLDNKFNKKTMEEFYEKLKKMPRDKITQFLETLGKNSQIGNNNFESIDESTRMTAIQKLQLKKQQLKMKRTSKFALTKIKETAEKKQLIETPDETKTVPPVETSTATSTETPTKMTKSKKKRERQKAKKLAKSGSAKTTTSSELTNN